MEDGAGTVCTQASPLSLRSPLWVPTGRCISPVCNLSKASPFTASQPGDPCWHWIGGTDLFLCHCWRYPSSFQKPTTVRSCSLPASPRWEALSLMVLTQWDRGGTGRDITRTVLHPSFPCSQGISRPPLAFRNRCAGGWDRAVGGSGQEMGRLAEMATGCPVGSLPAK